MLAETEYYNYLEIFSGKRNKFIHRIIKKLTHNILSNFYLDSYFDKSSLLRLENYIDCETHREFVLGSLKIIGHGK